MWCCVCYCCCSCCSWEIIEDVTKVVGRQFQVSEGVCHSRFTTANLSYRFPIFEASAIALCGTTGQLAFVRVVWYFNPHVNANVQVWKSIMVNMVASSKSNASQLRSFSPMVSALRLDVSNLMLDSATVSAPDWISPGHQSSVLQNGHKCAVCPENLSNVLKLRLNYGAVTTLAWMAPRHYATICLQSSKRIKDCIGAQATPRRVAHWHQGMRP